MFLFTIKRSRIKNKLKSFNVKEIKENSFIITIVTDNFLSKYVSEPDGFSIIESPLILTKNFRDVIFSQVKYRKNDNSFEIFKSTISGRPIYYHINSKGEFFCSTHISMLRKTGVKIEENIEVLHEFFVYRFVMPPPTLYKNIDQLFMGDRLQIKIVGEECAIKSLDRNKISKPDQSINSIKNSSEQIYNDLSKSIERLNPCKDKIGVLFSGGIDSSIMSKICQNNFGIVKSYSTGYPFEDPKLNVDKRNALSAGEALGINHNYYEATIQDYLSGFLEAISLAEEPLHHLHSVCFHLLFKNGMPKNINILIHGQDAGPFFGNFGNYLYMKDKMRVKLFSKRPLKGILRTISKITGKGKRFIDILNKSTLKYPLSNPDNPIWSWRDFASKKWVCDYFNITEDDIIKGRYNLINQFENKSIYDIWSLYNFFGEEDITLSIWTKIGEGNKKILYSPYYDFDVLNYVFSIPWKVKLKRPENILRKEIARQAKVPEFIITRPKTGFGVKRKDWALKGGVFEPLIPLAAKVFDEKEIRKMQSYDQKKAMTFWNMLNYAIWKRLFINDEPLNELKRELDKEI